MPMNNRLLVPRKVPGLLDLVPGAAAAYSLRSLSNSYAGPVVTVRRSSDDAEADFTAAEVSDGTLAAFCGAGDGFVYRWWDQSGNARHAVAAADTNEPKIVSSGVVVTEESKPALQFDGSNDTLAGFSSALQPASLFAVANCTLSGNYPSGRAILGSQTTNQPLAWIENGRWELVRWGQNMSGPVAADGTTNVLSATNSASTTTVYVNGGDAVTNASGTFVSGSMSIGSANGTQFFIGKIAEIIVYDRVFSATERQLVEGNIAWSYSV